MVSGQTLHLKGLSFSELLLPEGLAKLDNAFLQFLQQVDKLLYGQLQDYRQGVAFSPLQVSEWLIQSAPIFEAFIAELFDIEEAVGRLQAVTLSHAPLFAFKKYYVLRQGRRGLKKADSIASFSELNQWVSGCLRENNFNEDDRELAIAEWGQQLLQEPHLHQAEIERLTEWCVAALTQEEGQAAVAGWVSFHLPQPLDYENLVATVPVPDDTFGRIEAPHELWRQRDGFRLTDPRMGLREVMDHVHYCVYCHKTEGDFCSKGFPVKKGNLKQGLKINPVGETLTGCPLEEKISEMHVLKKAGYNIAALAVIMIDNPMCPATGHRICNDCMKACIYQKQEPVNIPQTETRILTDVLDLPWGVEIYDLFSRWNPLRREQYVAKPYNGKKVLVMGMGPAGFTLAHYLLMEGFAVVGAEGLKIEPLPTALLTQPIYCYGDLKEQLDDRVMAGFGGVAEYGITVRWDKNFLKLIYISLMRRPYFQIFGSIRFGGTLWVKDAWRLGFDHLAVAVGAGLPRELPIAHSLAPGMRQANDFLMALQLTGAAKASSLANLQVRLPAAVIGGGLTGIDTATEVQAYYIAQVEKILYRYQLIKDHFGEKEIRSRMPPEALAVLQEFLEHGRQVQEERVKAREDNRPPDFIRLIRAWGGVTIIYRRTMQESPAYKRNHEEVMKALEEGVYYAQGLEPKAVRLDTVGHVAGLVCRARVLDEEGVWMTTDEDKLLPVRSIFVATGATPNIAYEYEHRGTFLRDSTQYRRFDLENNHLVEVKTSGHCKIEDFGPFTSYTDADRHRVSFLGDTHPIFHGSVVKAIASGKRIYPKITAALLKENPAARGDFEEYQRFRQQMISLFRSEVVSVVHHAPNRVELKVRAPIAAQNFRPGQFYRLQNYESLAPLLGHTRLQTEAMAMIAVAHADEPDMLSFMVLGRGASSRLVATFRPGQPIAVMGPTGCRDSVPEGEGQTIMIIGGSMAGAYIRSMGPALREKGHRVFYVACLETLAELYCRNELEAAADVVLWLTEKGKELVLPERPQDMSASGELITVLRRYALGEPLSCTRPGFITLQEIRRVIVIGSTHLIRRVQQARTSLLRDFFAQDTQFVASVYGPMQCMMKGVCAQCLQWQIDPVTGRRTKAVYACSWQHQPMEKIDIQNIDERLSQNSMQETLTDLWLSYLVATHSSSLLQC